MRPLQRSGWSKVLSSMGPRSSHHLEVHMQQAKWLSLHGYVFIKLCDPAHRAPVAQPT